MTALADIDLVLASASPYRRALLGRITPRFRVLPGRVDETASPSESPARLAARLALAKTHAVAAACINTVIVGSDQVAELDGCALGKPGTPDNARAQLDMCSGREVLFHTALCLLDTRGSSPCAYAAMDTTRVLFRTLDTAEIARYVEREQPLDCAGSFKCEALGIALFERIETDDPTALVGLPLIALCRLLREAGIDPV